MDDGALEQLGQAVLRAAAQHKGRSPIGQLAQSVLDGEISLRGGASLPFLTEELARAFAEGLARRDQFANDPRLRELTDAAREKDDEEPPR